MSVIASTPMKAPAVPRPPVATRLGLVKSLLLTLSMMLLSAMLITQGRLPDDALLTTALGVTWLGFNTAFFLMLWTGRTDHYRAILFVTIALSMIVTFSALIQAERGSNVLTVEDVINGRTPFCPLVIPMILLPAALTRTIIFPGSLLSGFAGIAFMIVLWIGSSLVLGRGFCSWMCFYGGYDEGCSRLAKRARIRTIDRRWTYFPFALLLAIVLISAVTLEPIYCSWFCPFKAVTEYGEVTSIIAIIQTVIFIGLFVGLVLVLPFLTRRRVQCGRSAHLGLFNPLRIQPMCSMCASTRRNAPAARSASPAAPLSPWRRTA